MIPTWPTTMKLLIFHNKLRISMKHIEREYLVCRYNLLVIRSDTILAVFNYGHEIFKVILLRNRRVHFGYLGSEARRGRIHENI